jgi:hypothetical protein
VDGASGSSATNHLSVIAVGSSLTGKYGVLVFGKDGSGNSVELPIGTSGLKVEASDLDIRNLTFALDKVDASGSEISLSAATLAALENISVTATDLDIRNLSHSQDSVKIGDGTDLMAVNSDGSINVNVVLPSGKVCDYKTTATAGVGTEVLHMYTVTSGKKFNGKSILVGARGAVKIRFGLSTDGIAMTTVKGVYFQDPKENEDRSIECLELLGDGTKTIAIGITNLDGSSSDVYSTLQGFEV